MNDIQKEDVHPCLSVVIVAYNMERELPRTIYTLSYLYQKNISPADYEIIVVDNGSLRPVDSTSWKDLQAWPDQIRLLRLDNASPSPVHAINKGVELARGSCIGVMIDGARMCSPGLLGHALQACKGFAGAVVGALGWYLGPDFQRQSMALGYDQFREDALLDSIDWKNDGYQLYAISSMDESSMDGWYAQFAELNAIFMQRKRWIKLGGYDENFDMPGGGLANLDFCKRALEMPDAQGILLMGEATFHQFHGGAATNSAIKKAIDDWEKWSDHYRLLRGKNYELPQPVKPIMHFGYLPDAVRVHYLRALVFNAHPLLRKNPPMGNGFELSHWAMPDEVWSTHDTCGISRQQAEAIQRLLAHAIQRGNYHESVIACRWIYREYPAWKAPAHLLSIISPWLPHGNSCLKEEHMSPFLHAIQLVLNGSEKFGYTKIGRKEDCAVTSGSNRSFQKINADIAEKLPTMTEKFSSILMNNAAFIEPHHLTHPAPWAGHIPFASWLLNVHQPRILVELGTYSGISYLSFCQSIVENRLHTRTWAVDTWQGDAHAGAYDDSIYQALRSAHDPHYKEFSTLMRMTFDEALTYFEDGTVDLLHIDGLHTYEAVLHDFETWLPKLSDKGVVLFHDTNVYRDDFGVHRLWAELSQRYPSLQFMHSNGLGVLLVGTDQPEDLKKICDVLNVGLQEQSQTFFASIGARLERRAEVLALNIQLKDAEYRAEHEKKSGLQRHEWIEKLDNDIAKLSMDIQERDRQLAQCNDQLRQKVVIQQQLEAVYRSRSWRATAPLRAIATGARRFGVAKVLRRGRNALRYVLRGDMNGLLQRIHQLRQEKKYQAHWARLSGNGVQIGIMATAHTMFIAHLIEDALLQAGLQAQIVHQPQNNKSFPLDCYIVICPQMFKVLPPGQQRIVFQMEQGVSSRWFTPVYIEVLENSLAVLDYASANLPFLHGKGLAYPHVYFLPIGGFSKYPQYLKNHGEMLSESTAEPVYDILFYGDVNSPRRQLMLKALGDKFKLRIEGNLFGEQLHQAIRSARLVVNIHYYEDALLETTRIYECLSLGIPVVSESSTDIENHPELVQSEAISFSPIGDIDLMVAAVKAQLDKLKNAELNTNQNFEKVLEKSGQNFKFMLYRALYALKIMSHAQWRSATESFELPASKIVLGLPETWRRRSHFISNTASALGQEVELFDGVRYNPGWMGCALSYKYLAQKGLKSGLKKLEISEDDIALGEGYAERRAIIDEWLELNQGQWDIFSGLIAVVHPETKILAVHDYNGQRLVIIDRMMSAVHNIYSREAMELLADWDVDNTDPLNNTIDKYIQSKKNLRVVVGLPFLVGHEEAVDSSLWGFKNTQYAEMIEKSQKDLEKMVHRFLQ